MFYIVGLGNPGEEYNNTRHNVGEIVLKEFINQKNMPAPVASSKYAGHLAEGFLGGEEILMLFPDSFMNLSGKAVRKLVPKGQEEKLILIYDDVDLPFGEIKVSFGRGAGGHNGVDSVIAELDTKDFIRVRIGIAPKNFFGETVRPQGDKLANYVLGKLTKRELEEVLDSGKEAAAAIEMIVSKGKEVAMNEYN